MFCVVIPSPASAAQIQELLAALVPAAMDGLVRQVIVADAPEALAAFLEDAGATRVDGGLAAAAAAARCEDLLVLPPELRLPADWREQLASGRVRGQRAGLFGRVTGRVVKRAAI